MDDLSVIEKIINGAKILDPEGRWPNFEESHLVSMAYKRGVYIRDMECFEDPTIDVSIEFFYNDLPFLIDLQFRRCSSVVMKYFNVENIINRFSISVENRGFYADGITPLPSFLCVEIGTSEYNFCEKTGLHTEATVFMSFKCFEVEVLGKREIDG